MIGFYDYTVVLTYLSLLSAGTGVLVALSGGGHPFYGCLFLLLCGLCDAFDGKVARTKKDRTDRQKSYGIEIDSLADLLAFGMLPAAIGSALLRHSPLLHGVTGWPGAARLGLLFLLRGLLVLYVLAALIRLAWYNVSEQARQQTEDAARIYYTGLPVTASALVFPFILLLQRVLPGDMTPVYFSAVLLLGLAFISRVSVRKPGARAIWVWLAAGAVEFLLLLAGLLIKC